MVLSKRTFWRVGGAVILLCFVLFGAYLANLLPVFALLIAMPIVLGTIVVIPLAMLALITVLTGTMLFQVGMHGANQLLFHQSLTIQPLRSRMQACLLSLWRHRKLTIWLLYAIAWTLLLIPEQDLPLNRDDDIALVCLFPCAIAWLSTIYELTILKYPLIAPDKPIER